MDKKINVGLCAFGMSGKVFHAPFFNNHPLYELTGIVKRSEQNPIDQYPDTKIYSSIESLINDGETDLIVVNTPVQFHFEHCKSAIKAGKSVLVEKPFVVSSTEAQSLIELADKHKVKFTVFQNRRWDRDFIAVKDIVDKGVLGKIHEVEIRFDRFRTSASGKKHKEGNLPGSGALYDLGAHMLDQAILLFGLPDKLFADLVKLRPDVSSDDFFELLLYYNDLRVRLISDVMVKEPGPGYVMHGDKGSFIQQRSDVQEGVLVSGKIPQEQPWVPELESPDGLLHAMEGQDFGKVDTYSAPGNYTLFFDALAEYIQNDGPNPVEPSDAAKYIRLIELAFHSSEKGIAITL